MRKKTVKCSRRLLLFGVALLIAVSSVMLFGCSEKSGWNTSGDTTRYLDSKGNPQTGWQQIDGNCYYFMPEDGAMVTGWNTIDGQKYYFGENGARMTGWLEQEGKRYYLGDDGAATTGWQELDGNRYYFAKDGYAVTGWVVMDNTCYLFDDDGTVTTGWYEDDTGRYFFGEDGKPHTGWLQWEQKTYYLNANGSVTTGWMDMDGDRYYFLPTGRMAIGEVEVDGVTRFFTSKGKEVLMCNPWHAIPDDYVLDLVDFEGFKIARNTVDALRQMFADGRAAGAALEVNNSYRSIATQQYKWDTKVAERMAQGMTREEAEAKTGQSLAIPGHSEHHTGMALDINSGGNAYEWMAENCWDYGFIVRYPDNHLDVTGIIYEPWHFRYVGTELALELRDGGYCCLEDYLAQLTQQQKEIAD